MFENPLLFAFLLTLFAGLATGIGSLMAFVAKPTNHKFLSVALGFSAGVMLYVPFVEIFAKASSSLAVATNETTGYILATLGFFGGVICIAVLDTFVSDEKVNPHEAHCPGEMNQRNKKLLRMGVFTALAIAIHNFPEGLATFLSAVEDPALGVAIAIAIAIHNIPEGIAVSIPIYHATKSRAKAFRYSFCSGLAEPVGAILGYFILLHFFNDLTFGIIFAAVGGIMVFISLDQLLPTAQKYGEHHLSIYGLIAGMMVMAGSLILFMV